MSDSTANAREPSMEDILASIRRIIDEEDSRDGRPATDLALDSDVDGRESDGVAMPVSAPVQANRETGASAGEAAENDTIFPERGSPFWSRATGRNEDASSSDTVVAVEDDAESDKDIYTRAQNKLDSTTRPSARERMQSLAARAQEAERAKDQGDDALESSGDDAPHGLVADEGEKTSGDEQGSVLDLTNPLDLTDPLDLSTSVEQAELTSWSDMDDLADAAQGAGKDAADGLKGTARDGLAFAASSKDNLAASLDAAKADAADTLELTDREYPVFDDPSDDDRAGGDASNTAETSDVADTLELTQREEEASASSKDDHGSEKADTADTLELTDREYPVFDDPSDDDRAGDDAFKTADAVAEDEKSTIGDAMASSERDDVAFSVSSVDDRADESVADTAAAEDEIGQIATADVSKSSEPEDVAFSVSSVSDHAEEAVANKTAAAADALEITEREDRASDADSEEERGEDRASDMTDDVQEMEQAFATKGSGLFGGSADPREEQKDSPSRGDVFDLTTPIELGAEADEAASGDVESGDNFRVSDAVADHLTERDAPSERGEQADAEPDAASKDDDIEAAISQHLAEDGLAVGSDDAPEADDMPTGHDEAAQEEDTSLSIGGTAALAATGFAAANTYSRFESKAQAEDDAPSDKVDATENANDGDIEAAAFLTTEDDDSPYAPKAQEDAPEAEGEDDMAVDAFDLHDDDEESEAAATSEIGEEAGRGDSLGFTDTFGASDVYHDEPPELDEDYSRSLDSEDESPDERSAFTDLPPREDEMETVGGMVRDAMERDPVDYADPAALVSMTSEEISARALASLADVEGEASRRVYGALRISDRGDSESLEGMVQGMLRPMLREWLDDNLPGMVESAVRGEVERISAKSRKYSRASRTD